MVYSCHFSWWQDDFQNFFFENEWLNLQDSLRQSQDKGLKLILMGDFNNPAHILDQGYDLILKSGFLKDSFKVATNKFGEFTVDTSIDGWVKNTDHLRIDYIFVDKIIKVDKYEIVFNGHNQPVISDHFGILAELSK